VELIGEQEAAGSNPAIPTTWQPFSPGRAALRGVRDRD
jgi:hypothetical protein